MTTLTWMACVFVLCVIAIILCGILFREAFFLWDKNFFKRRAHWQFALAFIFIVTASVAAIYAPTRFNAGPDNAWGVIRLLTLVLAAAFALWALYLTRLLITDVLENFGLIKPRVDIHRFLRERPDTGSDELFVMPEGIDDEPQQGDSKKKKKPRRRWWTARRWRTRVHEIRRLFPHRRPIGRDEF